MMNGYINAVNSGDFNNYADDLGQFKLYFLQLYAFLSTISDY